MKDEKNYQEANKRYFRAQKIDKLLRVFLFISLAVLFYSLIYAFWLFRLLFLGLILFTIIVVLFEFVEWMLS